MKFKSYFQLFLVLVIVFNTNLTSAKEIRDIINPVKLVSGKPDTIIICDLFYADNYNLSFIKSKEINNYYDKTTKKLVLKPERNFIGISLVEFIYENQKYAFPVIVENPEVNNSKHVHNFHYKPNKEINKVTVTGSFNGWNRSANIMSDKDNDGVYETSIQLEPGNYVYKFNVDGKEIIDPENPERAPTGFDDFNSLLVISDQNEEKNFLHILGKEITDNSVKLSFALEKENPKIIKPGEVFTLLDNFRLEENKIKISGNKITLFFNKEELEGEKTIRVIVCLDGKPSNLQTIILNSGIPLRNHSLKWNDGIIYSIMVDRFNDGDKTLNNPVQHDSLFYPANYQGGDLQGILNKINDGYFDSLGINILWISPVYDNPNIAYREYPKPNRWYSGYHGYWPIHHQKVEEKFGNIEKLKELVKRAHDHNIKVLLDFVANHVHIEHPFYKEHPEWFGKLELPDGRLNLRFWDEFRLTTWFEPYMPSFDYLGSKDAIDAMTENAVWWLKETGADGYRHDAVKHVPNEFWRALTERINREVAIPSNKKVYQIGETFGDYELVNSYINNGQLSAQFNFNLSYFAIPVFIDPIKSFTTIDYHMKKSFSVFGYNNLMGNIMDSHDKVRFMAYADNDIPEQGVDTREIAWSNPPKADNIESYKKAELYLAYMLTIPGLPVIYYGSEYGMTGADDPDNRRMMRFNEQLSDNEKEMLEHSKTIINLRNEHTALRYGDFYTLKADQNLYAYIRSDLNERILVILNKGENKPVELELPDVYSVNKIVEINSKEEIECRNNKCSISLSALSFKIFKLL